MWKTQLLQNRRNVGRWAPNSLNECRLPRRHFYGSRIACPLPTGEGTENSISSRSFAWKFQEILAVIGGDVFLSTLFSQIIWLNFTVAPSARKSNLIFECLCKIFNQMAWASAKQYNAANFTRINPLVLSTFELLPPRYDCLVFALIMLLFSVT